MCPGCDNLRLCQTCDDHKHGAHRRSNIISVGCDFCNLRQAEVACLDCPAKSCPVCCCFVNCGFLWLTPRTELCFFCSWSLPSGPLEFQGHPRSGLFAVVAPPPLLSGLRRGYPSCNPPPGPSPPLSRIHLAQRQAGATCSAPKNPARTVCCLFSNVFPSRGCSATAELRTAIRA